MNKIKLEIIHFLRAIDNDNNEMVKLLIDYAKLNQVLSWLLVRGLSYIRLLVRPRPLTIFRFFLNKRFYGRWWLGFLFTGKYIRESCISPNCISPCCISPSGVVLKCCNSPSCISPSCFSPGCISTSRVLI